MIDENVQIFEPLQHSKECTQVFKALGVVVASITSIPKSGDNKFQKYKYSTLTDYMKVIKPLLLANELYLLTYISKVALATESDKKRLIRVTLRLRLIHSSGEWFEIPACGEGEDAGDKALYKAITGGRKYGMSGMFCTDSDDSDEPEHDTREPTQKQTAYSPRPPASQRPAASQPPAVATNHDLGRHLNGIARAEAANLAALANAAREAFKSDKDAVAKITTAYNTRKKQLTEGQG
jgi:hypothetical protein